jgi:hypothetical protein
VEKRNSLVESPHKRISGNFDPKNDTTIQTILVAEDQAIGEVESTGLGMKRRSTFKSSKTVEFLTTLEDDDELSRISSQPHTQTQDHSF